MVGGGLDPVRRDGTRVLEVGRDGARDLGRDVNRVLGVRRDGARTQGVGQDGARGLGVGRDLLIRLELSGEVSVGANFLALGIPNIDTRHKGVDRASIFNLGIPTSLKKSNPK